jgi:hypothetical protein
MIHSKRELTRDNHAALLIHRHRPNRLTPEATKDCRLLNAVMSVRAGEDDESVGSVTFSLGIGEERVARNHHRGAVRCGSAR